jgi:hypothetical protein
MAGTKPLAMPASGPAGEIDFRLTPLLAMGKVRLPSHPACIAETRVCHFTSTNSKRWGVCRAVRANRVQADVRLLVSATMCHCHNVRQSLTITIVPGRHLIILTGWEGRDLGQICFHLQHMLAHSHTRTLALNSSFATPRHATPQLNADSIAVESD